VELNRLIEAELDALQALGIEVEDQEDGKGAGGVTATPDARPKPALYSKSTEVKRDEAVDGDEAASLKGAADDTSLKVTARKHQIALERLRGLLLAETVKTPATGRGATRPDPMYTIRPNVGAVARPTPSTGRTIADGNAAYKLQLGVEGALFKLHRMLPATVKRLCPFGVADLDDMPGGAHNDTLHRLDADDAVYEAGVACFRGTDTDITSTGFRGVMTLLGR